MASQLIWRLEEGYSRFIEESRVELRLKQGPFGESLEFSPKGMVDHTQPIEFHFQAARTFSGRDTSGLAWRLRPEAAIDARILFPGNAFLGNFRVPFDHFAVQWDLEAQAEGSIQQSGRKFLVDLAGQSRLYQSWVTLFSKDISMIQALHQAWGSYRSPLDADEVLQMSDGQVLRWRWSGHLRLGLGVEWSLAAGWTIPGKIPLVNLHKELFSGVALEAKVQVREEGEFSLQLRKRATGTEFRLRRTRQRTKESSFFAGVDLGSQLRVSRLGPSPQGVLRIAARGLSQPIRTRMNRGLKQALTRSLEISLTLEKERWKRRAALWMASWSEATPENFRTDYSRLLRGSLPTPRSGVQISGSFERIRGRRLTLRFNLLNWAGIEKSSEHESRQTLRISPAGDLVLENTREYRKHRHDWNEAQFLRLVDRETIEKGRRRRDFLWSYSQEEEFAHAELRQLLKMSLRMGVLNGFVLPSRSLFPLTAQLLVVTRFSSGGLASIREASHRRKWEVLVRSLEMVTPKQYAEETFWRDWVDYPEVPQENRPRSDSGVFSKPASPVRPEYLSETAGGSRLWKSQEILAHPGALESGRAWPNHEGLQRRVGSSDLRIFSPSLPRDTPGFRSAHDR
jgi:hypothetical protein